MPEPCQHNTIRHLLAWLHFYSNKKCCNFSAVDYIKGTRHVNKGSTLLASYRTAFLSNSQEESKNRFD